MFKTTLKTLLAALALSGRRNLRNRCRHEHAFRFLALQARCFLQRLQRSRAQCERVPVQEVRSLCDRGLQPVPAVSRQ